MESTKKGKRELISKANTTMVAVSAIGAFLIVFSLVASKALWSQRAYQAKIISKKEKAVDQLEKNQKAVEELKVSYAAFVGAPDNIIGGNPNGAGDKDGNNAKIVLDALPSKYDFPAFVTSIKKLLAIKGLTPDSISGKDDEVAQGKSTESKPVEIPFKVSANVGGFTGAKELLRATELSIRPIKVKKMTVSGEDGAQVLVDIDAVSNYQGAKGLTITKEVVK